MQVHSRLRTRPHPVRTGRKADGNPAWPFRCRNRYCPPAQPSFGVACPPVSGRLLLRAAVSVVPEAGCRMRFANMLTALRERRGPWSPARFRYFPLNKAPASGAHHLLDFHSQSQQPLIRTMRPHEHHAGRQALGIHPVGNGQCAKIKGVAQAHIAQGQPVDPIE